MCPPTQTSQTPRKLFLSRLQHVYLTHLTSHPKEVEECFICTQQLCDVDGCNIHHHEEPIQLPCGHVFGTKCAATWFGENDTCPMCRAVMIKNEARSYWF